jgi:hypothetical protein
LKLIRGCVAAVLNTSTTKLTSLCANKKVMCSLSIRLLKSSSSSTNDKKDEETQEIVRWLSPLNFWPKQTDVFDAREAGTGQWLLDDPVFREWANGNEKTIWCRGGRKLSFVIGFLRLREAATD